MRNHRTRLAILAVPALLASMFVAATPAAATESDILLDERCITSFYGSYPISDGFTIAADVATIAVSLPDIVANNIYGPGLVLDFSISGPGGRFDVERTDSSASFVEFAPPEAVFDGAISGTSTVTVSLTSLLHSHPCPAASDPNYLFEMRLTIVATIGPADPGGFGAVRLNNSEHGIESALLTDSSTQPRTRAAWGDQVTLRARPGYFTAGPTGEMAPVAVRAELIPVPLYSERVDLEPPIISTDGSTALVTLPTEPPPSDPDDPPIWESVSIGIYLDSEAAGSADAFVDLRMDPLVVTGPRPSLSVAPRVGIPVTAKTGTWQPANVTLTYQWYLDGKPVRGATGNSFTPRWADRGRMLAVRVTGSAPGFESFSAASKAQKIG